MQVPLGESKEALGVKLDASDLSLTTNNVGNSSSVAVKSEIINKSLHTIKKTKETSGRRSSLGKHYSGVLKKKKKIVNRRKTIRIRY